MNHISISEHYRSSPRSYLPGVLPEPFSTDRYLFLQPFSLSQLLQDLFCAQIALDANALPLPKVRTIPVCASASASSSASSNCPGNEAVVSLATNGSLAI